ncbi:hypothetical protein BOW86_gp212 [Synechococcus phage S-CAM7]|uniref:Uncharacterized protein n=1 Tax=Synechococcus phage S-CAM7 TaxID=1883368 RepID=A0A1D8KU50_9CAUD|nr:hypothetical protein BOW86_gp212 [Synechococcus phage S-CAM7]AOV62169.1 hypothetical protein C490910_246 [Synechococcus phage S-CAM7]
MNPIYYLDAVLVIIVFIAITDANVAPWLGLQFKVLTVELRRQWLLLKMKPDLWLMKWRMKRVLKKLQQDAELQAIIKEHYEQENKE